MRKKIILFLFIFLLGFLIWTKDFLTVFRALIGLVFFLSIAYLVSEKRKKIDIWQVIQGISVQILMAFLILKVYWVQIFFEKLAFFFLKTVTYSKKGTEFLFASFGSGVIEQPFVNFLTTVLPPILFFSALSALLYHFGIIQKLAYFFAFFLKKPLKISSAESLVTVTNVFLGPLESVLMIRQYLERMNRSQMMLLLTGGMSTITGSLMTVYMYYLGGDSQVEQAIFGQHLMAASWMSAPAAVIMAKIIVPQTEKLTEINEIIPEKSQRENVLSVLAQGTADGLKLVVHVAAILLVFVSLVSMINELFLIGIVGKYTGLNTWITTYTSYSGLSFEFILACCFAPFAYFMGVVSEDVFLVAQLLGQKTVLNEFVAYHALGEMKQMQLFSDPKSVIIATYALCGFSNLGSVGMLTAGIAALVPHQKKQLGELGLKALLAASLACILTAVVASIII